MWVSSRRARIRLAETPAAVTAGSDRPLKPLRHTRGAQEEVRLEAEVGPPTAVVAAAVAVATAPAVSVGSAVPEADCRTPLRC